MTISDPIVTRFFRWASDRAGLPAKASPPQRVARLDFYTINPLRLRTYEARHLPVSLQPRASWFTLLYWQQLLDDFKPEPWAPAVLHFEVDLRETVNV